MGLSLRGQSSGAIDINAPNAAGNNTITLPGSNGAANQFYKNSGTAGTLTHSSMIEDSSGQIGIGTVSPRDPVHIYHPTNNVNLLIESGDANSYLAFKDNATTSDAAVYLGAEGNNLKFITSAEERLRITSGGNVNIGGEYGQTDSKVTIVDASRPIAEATLNLQSSTTSGAQDTGPVLRFYGHSGSEGRYHASIKGAKENGTSGNTAGYLAFNTRPAGGGAMVERLRITSNGQVQATGPGSSGSVISSKVTTNNGGYLAYEGIASNNTTTFSVNHNGTIYTASGLNFGTPASPITSQTLDDYEEGTFTPEIFGLTIASYGHYVKVGNLVTCIFYINIGTKTYIGSGSGTTSLQILLPFNNNNPTNSYAGASIGNIRYIDFSSGSVKQFAMNIGGTDNRLTGRWFKHNSNFVDVLLGDLYNNFSIHASVTYQAT